MDLNHFIKLVHACPIEIRAELSNMVASLMSRADRAPFEYEVYLLDPRWRLMHKDDALLATDNLAIACSWCYEYYKKFNIPVCVYQPRTFSYREMYADWLETEDF
jgi:hypothetical protein